MFPGALTELEPVPSGEQPSPGGTKEPQSGGDRESMQMWSKEAAWWQSDLESLQTVSQLGELINAEQWQFLIKGKKSKEAFGSRQKMWNL